LDKYLAHDKHIFLKILQYAATINGVSNKGHHYINN